MTVDGRSISRFPIARPRSLLDRRHVKDDALAGLVLGVESVPDGLASGLLAAVNPVAGVYAYLFGMVGGALFTSTALMAIQGTGAMSVIVADIDLGASDDPTRALVTLSLLTGAVMIAAGLLRLGTFLRFVSSSVMTGFVSAVGLNIVLGQLDNLTGYETEGANRVVRAIDLVLNLGDVNGPSILTGGVTIALILWLQRTRLGAMGLVVAIVVGSAVAALLKSLDHTVAVVGDVATIPAGLPAPALPSLRDVPALLVPAASLAFVGLVQGAGVSAGVPNRDGAPSDASQDFVGQGVGNVAAGVFQGMPVGGSMSASSLVVKAGARTRMALLVAGAVMAAVMVSLGGLVEQVAMPALAGLLIVVGVSTIKVRKLVAVARTGAVPLTVMSVTLVLTMLMPLQYAVLVGVGISVLLFVIGQSSRLSTRRIVYREDGRMLEVDPPRDLTAGEVVVLQPYGAIFFATAAALLEQMPSLTPTSRHAVVILRLRGTDDAGATLLDVLASYAASLRAIESKLVIVTDNRRFIEQVRTSGGLEPADVYEATPVVGETVRRAHDDAVDWIAARRRPAEHIVRAGAGPPRSVDPHWGDWPPDQMAR